MWINLQSVCQTLWRAQTCESCPLIFDNHSLREACRQLQDRAGCCASGLLYANAALRLAYGVILPRKVEVWLEVGQLFYCSILLLAAPPVYLDLALLLLRFNRLILFFFHCSHTQTSVQMLAKWTRSPLVGAAGNGQGASERSFDCSYRSEKSQVPWHAWSQL